jgi:catechol 2,3-dioxygenase-like lactoylglutathione lyase family enzyme
MIAEQPTPATAEQKQTKVPFEIKKLGHAVYYVSDMDRTVKFYTEVLPFYVTDINEQGMVFLRCQSDHHTIGFAERPKAEQPSSDYLRIQHLAFEVPSMDDLFRIRDWLREHNVPIKFEGRKGPGCNPGVEFLDPDGYTIELYAGMEQIGWDGKSRPSKFWRRAKSLEEAVANPPPSHD